MLVNKIIVPSTKYLAGRLWEGIRITFRRAAD
jgi:hypothetical protein